MMFAFHTEKILNTSVLTCEDSLERSLHSVFNYNILDNFRNT